jgi:hypothetical protein
LKLERLSQPYEFNMQRSAFGFMRPRQPVRFHAGGNTVFERGQLSQSRGGVYLELTRKGAGRCATRGNAEQEALGRITGNRVKLNT